MENDLSQMSSIYNFSDICDSAPSNVSKGIDVENKYVHLFFSHQNIKIRYYNKIQAKQRYGVV